MPCYQYSCPKEHAFEVVLPVADYRTPQACPECGTLGRRIISLPLLVSSQGECNYRSPIDGRPITSRAARIEDMRRNGCREYDPEMKVDAERFRARSQAELEAKFDDTIEREIDKMPSGTRERLGNELQSGADISVERR
jgi:putative FmdB family regulatory protein